ncbi:MAG: RNA 3'-terminal phosphate cyclase [Candidatus Diapherotrites archaeon]|uniref:RNA 3'-terminal phosphate cyclase n=1 Tax=Candidatus Iainarchaeum sp. TaxID=3101447 RepID=A0A939C9R9_9ARCH|nr:RNA 3'-terminal phosphate cyclase [Candidatus Diapherotrites archaeon]
MADAIEIDGSMMEGGGQTIRTALALSALARKPVKITKARASRPKPGLKPQHLAAAETLAEICSAGLRGAKPNSTELEFSPNEIKPANLNVRIGTAGSISLLLQQVLPVSLLQEIKLRIVGGTNVAWAPPVEFLQAALFPVLRKSGARLDLKVRKRGFFPKGQGVVHFSSKPAKLPLKPISLTELGGLESIEIVSSSASLPKDVSRNQAVAARHALQHLNLDFIEKIESSEHLATIGSAISVFARFSKGAVLSGSALGMKGKPAEQVGKEAAQALLAELEAKQPCDSHLADQLIPFMALAKGKSEIRATKLTQHCLTNIAVTEKFLPVKFSVRGSLGEPAEISVEGHAFSP